MKKSIYLDYNATGVLRPEVREAVSAFLDNDGNPSSVHHRGRAARAAVDGAREAVAALVGAQGQQVVFTSGGTEANNQAVRGVGAAAILMSATEHDSTIGAAYASGAEVHEIPVDGAGLLKTEALKAALEEARKASKG
ncbi:MAG: aminotransferase class V-fold PLP-dependent enzyme, partial [Sphingomonadales bacterium]